MKRSKCEYTGWIVAWVMMILAGLFLLDDIRISRIVVDYENQLKECNYNDR